MLQKDASRPRTTLPIFVRYLTRPPTPVPGHAIGWSRDQYYQYHVAVALSLTKAYESTVILTFVAGVANAFSALFNIDSDPDVDTDASLTVVGPDVLFGLNARLDACIAKFQERRQHQRAANELALYYSTQHARRDLL